MKIGKQITDLTATETFTIDDLVIVRKNGDDEDKAISYQNVKKSLGDSSIEGFVATSNEANKINLVAVNECSVDEYINFMQIRFISPIDSNAPTLKINGLDYKNLKIANTDIFAKIAVNDFITAVLIDNTFFKVNNLISNVITNDYTVFNVVKDPNNRFTRIHLKSAFGLEKKSYYEGMTINFLCTEDTVGYVSIKIDNISPNYVDVFLNTRFRNSFSTAQANLYKDQIVYLRFDGVDFILDDTKKFIDDADPNENLAAQEIEPVPFEKTNVISLKKEDVIQLKVGEYKYNDIISLSANTTQIVLETLQGQNTYFISPLLPFTNVVINVPDINNNQILDLFKNATETVYISIDNWSAFWNFNQVTSERGKAGVSSSIVAKYNDNREYKVGYVAKDYKRIKIQSCTKLISGKIDYPKYFANFNDALFEFIGLEFSGALNRFSDKFLKLDAIYYKYIDCSSVKYLVYEHNYQTFVSCYYCYNLSFTWDQIAYTRNQIISIVIEHSDLINVQIPDSNYEPTHKLKVYLTIIKQKNIPITITCNKQPNTSGYWGSYTLIEK